MGKLNDGQKGRLDDQLLELRRVVVNGTRDLREVTEAVQALIEGRRMVAVDPNATVEVIDLSTFEAYPATTALPDWYVDPGLRLEAALRANRDRGWGFAEANFQAPPDVDGILLLVVKLARQGRKLGGLQRTFDDRWNLMDGPKWVVPGFQTDAKHLRLALGYQWQPEVYWAQFEPNAFVNVSPSGALDEHTYDLAGTEVLDAAWQFPEWKACWFGDGNVAPNMAALQYHWDGAEAAWAFSPYLDRRGAWLDLDARSAGDAHPLWGCPRVRRVLL